ncbi:MAG TPA: LL-diaminopimelate aminotransferase [Nitrospirota bacterium]|nr:LL-diaminopimelate aminotransferase [Nitrospirota bacterium]
MEQGMNIIADRVKSLPPYLFTQLRDKIRQAEANGIDLISLAIGDPVEPTPAYIVETLRAAALDPANHQYPTDEHKGMLVFREAVARWYGRRYGVTLDPETEVLALSGVKEGIHHFIMALVNPGDVVLVTNPGYPAYRANALMAGAEVYEVPLLAANGFLPAFEDIPEKVCRRTKAFFLNYPNNPTGACADRQFVARLVAWATERRILLVLDNPYGEIVFSRDRKLSLLQIPGAKDISVELNSLSKAYNMTGWRIGMAVGSSKIIQAMCKFSENVASGVFNAIQLAGVTAMDKGDQDIENMLAIYRRRRETVLRAFSEMGVTVNAGAGTFYLWLPVPAGRSSLEFASKLLEEAGVLVTPGAAYGQYGEGYFRLSLTVPDVRLEEALERMRRAARKGW